MTGLLNRTYWTTIYVSLVVMLAIWSRPGPEAALVFALGVVVGALFLAAVAFFVDRTIRPSEERPARQWRYRTLHIGKFLLAAGAMYAVARWSLSSLPFFAAGYTLPTIVLILKLAGADLNRKLGVAGSPQDGEQGSG